jgi:CheY-like chemotaxis protein
LARKILLADDSVTAQNMGRKILTDAGYEVTTVNNGSAALKKIAESLPELIVLDVYMPGYSGLEVCQRLKETRETARIPVLLTVGKLEPFKPEDARRARADAFIIKPFEASELLTALTKLEDKIVPQPAHKTGQFAKAWAELEQGPDAKGEKFGDSDTGWKNRLNIPPPGQKHEKPEPEEVPPAKAQDGKGKKDKQDKPDAKPVEVKAGNAPASAGVPADITPEEIAAIAAAAAAFEEKTNPAPAEFAVRGAEVPEEPAVKAAALSAPAPPVESRPAEAKQVELAKEAPLAVEAAPKPSEAVAAQPEVEQKVVADEAAAAPVASEPQVAEKPVEAPVTVAAAAIAAPISAKWVAKEVVLEAGEGSASLEDEMKKARAVLQAATSFADFSAGAVAEPAPSAVAVEAAPEAVVTEAPREEAPVAISVAEPEPQKQEEPVVSKVEAEPPKAESAIPLSEPEPVVELSKADAEPAPAKEEPAVVLSQAEVEPAEVEPAKVESVVAVNTPEPETSKEEPSVVATQAEPEPPKEEPAAARPPEPEPELVNAVAAAAAAGPAAGLTEAIAAAPAAAASEAAPSVPETKAGETELAAAWAQWKQIRETVVGSQLTSQIANAAAASLKEAESASDSGEEDHFGEKSSAQENPAAIANIVDSVLAELKPKLVQEIAKKLGDEKTAKKKKK